MYVYTYIEMKLAALQTIGHDMICEDVLHLSSISYTQGITQYLFASFKFIHIRFAMVHKDMGTYGISVQTKLCFRYPIVK